MTSQDSVDQCRRRVELAEAELRRARNKTEHNVAWQRWTKAYEDWKRAVHEGRNVPTLIPLTYDPKADLGVSQ